MELSTKGLRAEYARLETLYIPKTPLPGEGRSIGRFHRLLIGLMMRYGVRIIVGPPKQFPHLKPVYT